MFGIHSINHIYIYFFKQSKRTLKAVSIEQVFAFLMRLDAALGAADALAGEPPQQPLTLEAVGRRRGRPHHEVVRRGGRDRVDQRLQCLLVHMHFLVGEKLWLYSLNVT